MSSRLSERTNVTRRRISRVSTTVGGIVLALVSSVKAVEAAENGKDDVARGRVIYNLDASEFFFGTFGPAVPETIDKFVDTHAAAGVTDLFINVNAQRTNYKSDVWESNWDGYDPTRGDDQPFFKGIEPERMFETGFPKSVRALHEQGCDYPRRMLERARHNKIGAWLSVRMNDSHYPSQPDHPFHSTMWRSHPQWHLSDKGLDYEQPEVREHYLKLIREVCSRYDIDGIELDFLRFWLYFRPGREHEGTKLMMDFMKQARSATREAEERLGHPVKLAVRVPATPWIARRHGLDATAWAKAGFVDLIVAGSFWSSVNSDIPVETWKGLLIGTGVDVAVHLEDGIDSGASGRRTMTHEEMRGVLVNGLHRGADAVYFFNLFTGPYQRWQREDHDRLIADAGSFAALRSGPRRHPLTITHPWSVGEPSSSSSLPFAGKHGVFRLHIGAKPQPEQETQIELVVPDHDQPLQVSLNGIPCQWSKLADPKHIEKSGWEAPQPPRHVYAVPAAAISDGYNLIEAVATQDVQITWVEIAVQ